MANQNDETTIAESASAVEEAAENKTEKAAEPTPAEPKKEKQKRTYNKRSKKENAEDAPAEAAPEFFVQADGLDISYQEVVNQVKSVISGEYSSLKIYLNLNERKVYAVVDEKINVNFPLK